MSIRRTETFYVFAPWCVVALFILKAFVTSVWIVRPWDIPDEVGHFSYIKDLAEGDGLPVLHETLLDDEVWPTFVKNGSSNAGLNWIAQHPPLYHGLMVPAYWIGGLFGSAFWGSFYMVRFATAVVFGMGIWILMKAFREFGLSQSLSLGLGIMIAAIPNHTYLAGGVNHDGLVFLVGSLVLLSGIRFAESGSGPDLLWLGLWLGLGGLVKYTLLVLVPPVLVLSLVRFFGSESFSWGTVSKYLLSVFIPIGIWVSRNFLMYGELLPIDTSGFQSDQPLGVSFLEFGMEFPLFSILIQSYWGLLGWMGDGNLQVRWLQMYSIYQQAYTLPLIVVLCLSAHRLIQRSRESTARLVCGIIGALLASFLVVGSGWLEEEFKLYLPVLTLFPAIGGWITLEAVWLSCARRLDTQGRIQLSCVLLFLFFLMVYLIRIYTFSESAGALQGTFGRYFLPLLGMIILGFLSPGLGRSRWATFLILGAGIVYSGTELYVWLHEAIPFFNIYG